MLNKQPVCSDPRSARLSTASGFTMCANCKPTNPILGPVWHPTKDMQEQEKISVQMR